MTSIISPKTNTKIPSKTQKDVISGKIFKDLFRIIEDYSQKKGEIVLSIILPMYNEERTIKKVIESLPLHDQIEIIIVNDKSTDNSINEIKKIDRRYKLKIISHEDNKGYGRAILSGIKAASGKILVTMDSDGQHDPNDLLNLILPILRNESDYTIGSRYLGTYFYRLPVSTRIGELFVEKLIQIFFGRKIMNNQNGFRAFNRKILPIFNDVKFEGYAFCTEQILRAFLEGYRIKEIPIKLYDRKYGASNIVLSKLAVNIFSLFFLYFIQKIKITVIKKNRKGKLEIYEKPLRLSGELKKLRFNKDLIYVNSIVFVEPTHYIHP